MIELLRRRAVDKFPQRAYTFLTDGETEAMSMTHAELDRHARAIAAKLQGVGTIGERVLLLYPPGLEYICAFFGCLYAGMIAVPVYPPKRNRPDLRLQGIVQDAQATKALTTTHILFNIEERLIHTPSLKALTWVSTDHMPVSMAEEWQTPAIDSNTLAFLQYTSGTTSLARGVMLTHKNLLYNSGLIQYTFHHTEQSRGVIWLPPYHDMGLIGGILQPLYCGFPVVLMSPGTFLQRPFRWLQAISRYQGTTSGGPNFAYDLCVRKITAEQRASLDLSSWEVAFNGAEPIRYETLKRFAEAFKSCGFRYEAFYPCYGLAEATLIVTGGFKEALPVIHPVQSKALESNQIVTASNNDNKSCKLVGCGHALSGNKIIIVDPESRIKCLPDQVGEIWVSSPGVAHGYWNRSKETHKIFQAYLADTGEGPFLRTGDLGFLKDNELVVTGRLKDVIIIRGKNYYPQDIEMTVGESHPALRSGDGASFSVEVDGEERLVIVQEIERKKISINIDEVIRTIRQAIARYYELQIYAVVIIKAGSLPRTSSGKIQRHACREKFLEGHLNVVGDSILYGSYSSEVNENLTREEFFKIAPEKRQSSLKAYLQKQVAQVLRIPFSQLDTKHPLSTLGIDSLISMELQNCLESSLGVAVSAEDFLGNLNIIQLTQKVLILLEKKEEAFSIESPQNHQKEHVFLPIKAIPRNGEIPLSFEQERLWFFDQVFPSMSFYNIPVPIHLKGKLDVSSLEKSLNEIIQRHEILRTTFAVSSLNERPIQIIAPPRFLTLPVIDLQELSQDRKETEAQRLAVEEVQQPFDLSQGPLVRSLLLRLQEDDHVLLLTIHHILFDGWSMGILLQEMTELYEAFSMGTLCSLPPLPIQYADYAGWQRQWSENNLEFQLNYWKNKLSGMPISLDLPTDYPRPKIQTFRGHTLSLQLSKHLSEELKSFSRNEGVTLFMTLCAVFLTLIYKLTDQKDFGIGISIANRSQEGVKKLIGLFLNQLVIRSDFHGNPTFRELLKQVRKELLDAYNNKELPFDMLVRNMQIKVEPGRTPLFQILFVLENTPYEPITRGGVTFETSPFEVTAQTSRLDSMICIWERENGFLISWEYCADLFENETIQLLLEAYRRFLKNSISQPEQSIAEFKLPEKLAQKITRIRQRQDVGNCMKIHHVGYACRNIEDGIAHIRGVYNVESVSEIVFDEIQNASLCFITTHNGINIELIAGNKVKSLLQQGMTLYHVCYEVSDIVQALETLKAKGADVIAEPKPAKLFDNRPVAFLHTELGLIELVGSPESQFRKTESRKELIIITATFVAEPVEEYMVLW